MPRPHDVIGADACQEPPLERLTYELAGMIADSLNEIWGFRSTHRCCRKLAVPVYMNN